MMSRATGLGIFKMGIKIEKDGDGISISGLLVDSDTSEIYFTQIAYDLAQASKLLIKLWVNRAPLATWDGKSVSDILTGANSYIEKRLSKCVGNLSDKGE
jgi:hypothetical protein